MKKLCKLRKIAAYILDPHPHTRAMYLALGLTALWCARRALRELPPKPPREELEPEMPVHSAIFRQPGPELNPIGAKLSAAIMIEVFEIDRHPGRDTPPSGIWTAREATSQNIVKEVGRKPDVFSARYRAAQLFLKQTGPWKINGQEEPTASGFHLHLDLAEPSLCGSRFHATIGNGEPGLAILLPDVRAGRRVLLPIEWDHLCSNCLGLVDHTPAPGDKIRVKQNAQLGTIMSVREAPAAKSRVPWYVFKYELSDMAQEATSALPATEFSLVMFEKDIPF